MGKKRRHLVSDSDILDTYAREKVINKTAKMLGLGESTIARVLAKAGVRTADGLTAYRRAARRYDDDAQAEILRRYEAGELFVDLVAEFGGTYDTLKRAIVRAGGKLREDTSVRSRPGEIDKIRELYRAGLSQQAISIKVKRSQSFVSRVMREHGLARRKFQPAGPEHPMWKGGEHMREGYVQAWVPADDPFVSMANQTGYVAKHRLVMARSLQRCLTRYETVHHIDGDPANNDLSNLQLRQGRHGKGVVSRCKACGSHDIETVPIAAVSPP